jgi:hypothetical protein
MAYECGLAFEKSQGFFGRFEGQFFGMVGIVEAQGDDGARLGHGRQWRQPNHLVKADPMAGMWPLHNAQLAI